MPQMPCTGTAPIGSSMREILEHVDGDHHDDARDRAQDDRARRRHPVAGAGDRDEAGEEAVHREADVPRLGFRIGEEHRGEAGGARGERRVGGDPPDAFEVHRGERAARIEAVPAEPQDQAADGRDAQIVRQHGSTAVALEAAADAGPRTIAPASATMPPIVCTTVEPAKSWKPMPSEVRHDPRCP